MSKSIYEEALEIMIDNILPREGGKVNKTKVIKALLQAQKQEKLLSLYKELSNYVCEQCYAHKLPEITRLKILIKELENERRK